MDTETVLTIYKADDLESSPDYNAAVADLLAVIKIDIKRKTYPAVLGVNAGDAINFIMSEEVQALKSFAEIGILFWGVLAAVKKCNKVVMVGKRLVKYLLSAIAKNDYEKEDYEHEDRFNSGFVWGPMNAEPVEGFSKECLKSWDGATYPIAYFMGVAFPVGKSRIKTYWYLISAGGEVCASWYTQTFKHRVPDFIRENIVDDDS